MTKLILLAITILLFMHDKPICDEHRMQEQARNAELVVLAEVIDVKPAPGFWSGQLTAMQKVDYKAIKILKGNLNACNIEVGHYVVHNSRTADNEQPRLSPKLFKKGQRLVLFLNRDPEKHYVVFDENCGAILADVEQVKLVQGIISGK